MQDYQPRPDLLQDRVIFITGAGSGIGRATALACAAHGATVILSGPIQKQLEAVYDEIDARGYTEAAIFVLDLEKAEDETYAGLGVTLGQEFGRLDGLVHNAAVLPFLSRIDDYELQAWNQVMQVSLTAPFLLTQACLPALRQSDDASIVFTSDTVGRQGKAYWGAYGVAKFGLEGLMQILAAELQEQNTIRVNSLDPGPVRSDLRVKVYPGVDPKTWARPEDSVVVNPYLYLLGPDSKGHTGQAFSAQAEH